MENVSRSEAREPRAQQRYRRTADILLAARTLGLAAAAQRVREVPLPELIESLRRRRAPSCADPGRARAAAGRALRLLRLVFGSLDTCLVRALTVARLLAPHHEVSLCLGFRPVPSGVPADGHAWLLVDGGELQVATPPDGLPYETATQIRFSDPAGEPA